MFCRSPSRDGSFQALLTVEAEPSRRRSGRRWRSFRRVRRGRRAACSLKHGGQELVSIAQRHFVSFHSEICVRSNFNTCVCNLDAQRIRGLVMVMVVDSPGMSRKPANNAFTRSVPA